MVKQTKRMTNMYSKINQNKKISIDKAINKLKEFSTVKFIESIDIAVLLGIDPKKSEQNIRNSVILPYGTGKNIKIAVFAYGAKAIEAKEAGADLIGMEDLAEKIKNNKKKIDIVITIPEAMNLVSKLAPVLGPRGIMPNPKLGTITENIKDIIKKIKKGQINYRNDKNGIIHTSVGKINFDNYKIKENIEFFIKNLKKYKPTQVKGDFIKKIYISSTMGVSIDITTSLINIKV
ncbi:50S ribosomal protein L1 [Enterobacteriaceae endosymbiont of Plateumaris braccata]|uniref:50S ribosomal protein L1 n=1 Tax=Enterobacteriaceae endosymbiont of Plateumaris braccata TaxID=2675793 RepID=UPI0014497417|nr:50S ribosomal protein L1 [Enterobacteriaceae endosymbiont of Plateumaris braccata]QJC28275.1 50S ribosomal protein L1 [Enterobacteriaceae endosymbiont of Plateumaris braccata]